MFSWIRRRATYANIAMTLALVFAMTGGAYAAKKYLITSTKQISPSVLKALAGKAGPAGVPGPAGPQGPAGAPGAKGETGAEGKTGPEGKVGPKGATGAIGPKGATGEPWTAGGTLPSGKTETGNWSAVGGALGGETFPYAISFPIPLAAPSAHVVRLNKAETKASPGSGGCELNVEDPAAKPVAPPDTLCVFTRDAPAGRLLYIGTVINEELYEGDNTTGAFLEIEGGEVNGVGAVDVFGTWAVTAK